VGREIKDARRQAAVRLTEVSLEAGRRCRRASPEDRRGVLSEDHEDRASAARVSANATDREAGPWLISPARARCRRPSPRITRARVLERLRLGDAAFSNFTRAAAMIVLASERRHRLADRRVAARFSEVRLRLLVTRSGTRSPKEFGALAPIYGTVVTSLIAMAIAVPLGLGIAVFLTEVCPPGCGGRSASRSSCWRAFRASSTASGACSCSRRSSSNTCSRFSSPYVRLVPVISSLFRRAALRHRHPDGRLILAIMVLPFMTSISRDVFEAVPPVLKEAAYGIGCTTWEVVSNVVIPYTRVGVVGGVMLGLGRALGETMAVTFVIGNAHRISASLFAPARPFRPRSPTNSPRRWAISTRPR
jgi:phosphate transport system permease protein